MTVADREHERSEKYRQELPRIIRGLQAGEDPVELARQVSESCGLEHRETYQWVQITEEQVERFRRRRAIITVIPIWIGGAAIVGAAFLVLQGVVRGGIALGSGGAILALSFTVLGRRLGRDPYERWLLREGKQ
ncbi:MAG: hypothetical protein EA427_08300 [Spirochaetaceae bacterium]|nr:MAG: hypothetical protein EA427_08300 [Spirochaetaceae bacterium]